MLNSRKTYGSTTDDMSLYLYKQTQSAPFPHPTPPPDSSPIECCTRGCPLALHHPYSVWESVCARAYEHVRMRVRVFESAMRGWEGGEIGVAGVRKEGWM